MSIIRISDSEDPNEPCVICRGCHLSGECTFNDWLNCQRTKELNNRHPVKKPKPTNFDNVTASPEALAKFIVEDAQYVGLCPFKQSPDWCSETTCEECIIKWFKQEANGETEQ